MRYWKLGQTVALLALLGIACGSSDRPAAQPEKKAAATASTNAFGSEFPTVAQPKLRTIKLWLGAEEMIVEVAATQKEITTGMMHRISIGENEGMLFVFPYPHQTAFWMKNTIIPLSCAYIDPDGVILETHEMFANDEKPIKAGTNRVQYVLEAREGWFTRHKVGPGVVVRTERGSLQETFFRKQ
jgi:uncharacterized protein